MTNGPPRAYLGGEQYAYVQYDQAGELYLQERELYLQSGVQHVQDYVQDKNWQQMGIRKCCQSLHGPRL